MASERWTEQVRRPGAGPRNYLREALISLEAILAISKDTGQTRYAFEAIENFPLVDVLRAYNGRLPLLRDERLRALWRDRSMPDLSTGAAVAMAALPEGSLGRGYGRFVEARGLENIFLEYLEIDTIEKFLIFRTAHLHDLFHFILGYDPYDPIGEMEVEAFLLAQTGGLNHALFLAGYVMFLLRNDPGQLARGAGRLREAYRLGERAEPLLLVRWEEQMRRPLGEVKRALGIEGRPECAARRGPSAPPRLAHLVFNVPDVERAVNFYQRVFGYQVAARDEALGVVFLTAGDDHHTVAVGESFSWAPWALPGSLWRGARRVGALLGARFGGERSGDGRRRVLPSLGMVRAAVASGYNHAGFRVASEDDLAAYYFRLRSIGAKVSWAVNHGDLIKGLYFRDPAGNMVEIFVDGELAREALARKQAGEPVDLGLDGELKNYEIDLERELLGRLDRAGVSRAG